MSKLIYLSVLTLVGVLLPDLSLAYEGEILADQLTAIEQLLIGGYSRLGLLGVAIAVAIIGAMKQNIGVLGIGVACLVFVAMAKTYITSSYTFVI